MNPPLDPGHQIHVLVEYGGDDGALILSDKVEYEMMLAARQTQIGPALQENPRPDPTAADGTEVVFE